MEKLTIEGTTSTPSINLDPINGKLFFSGESFPENAIKFYNPIIKWIRDYLGSTDQNKILVEFEIIYFNSSTSKIFMMIFDILEEAAKNGKSVKITWKASEENETAIECGEEFKEELKYVDFEILVS